MKKLCCVGLLAAMVLPVLGCNTVHGFGQDMKAGGQAIEKVSTDNGAKPTGTTTSKTTTTNKTTPTSTTSTTTHTSS